MCRSCSGVADSFCFRADCWLHADALASLSALSSCSPRAAFLYREGCPFRSSMHDLQCVDSFGWPSATHWRHCAACRPPSNWEAPLAYSAMRSPWHTYSGPSGDTFAGSCNPTGFSYILLHAAADERGQYGCALWLSKRLPYASQGSAPCYFDVAHCTVVAFSPRHLLVSIDAPYFPCAVLVAHAPSDPTGTQGLATAFWRARADEIRRLTQGRELVVLTDANGRLAVRPVQLSATMALRPKTPEVTPGMTSLLRITWAFPALFPMSITVSPGLGVLPPARLTGWITLRCPRRGWISSSNHMSGTTLRLCRSDMIMFRLSFIAAFRPGLLLRLGRRFVERPAVLTTSTPALTELSLAVLSLQPPRRHGAQMWIHILPALHRPGSGQAGQCRSRQLPVLASFIPHCRHYAMGYCTQGTPAIPSSGKSGVQQAQTPHWLCRCCVTLEGCRFYRTCLSAGRCLAHCH